MSEHEPDPGLDLRAELARIDRDRAETRKLDAEWRKLDAEARQRDEERRLWLDRELAENRRLAAESGKLGVEAAKLLAEAKKLDRDRWLAPALAIAAVIGGLLGTASFIASLIR